MQIGILGAGRMGQMLAQVLIQAGHSVILTNSRGPHSLAALLTSLGPSATAQTAHTLVAQADVVVLATRWEQTAAAVQSLGPWHNKIVIDTTNNRFGPGPHDVYDLGGRTSSEIVAELVPGARLVKAFNHQPIAALANIASIVPDKRKALFLAGDDRDAKHIVAGIIRDLGGEPIDTGNLREGGALQATGNGLLAGYGRLLTVHEARALLADVGESTGNG